MPAAALIAFILASASAAAPLDAPQQARLAALLLWADAYRSCYQPAAYSLRIDRKFTADCIALTLGRDAKTGSPDEQAALRALIAATPALVGTLNAPRDEPPARDAKPGSARPAAPAAQAQD